MLDDWQHLPQKVDASYTVVDNLDGIGDYYALDTENNPDGSLGQWSIAYRKPSGELVVCPFYGRKELGLGTSRGICIMHNAKWDVRVLEKAGIPIPLNIADSMIMGYCLGYGFQDVKDSSVKKSGGMMVGGLGLKYLARRHLGMDMKEWKEVYNKPEDVPEYNAQDSVATLLLFEKWKPQLPDFFWNIDMPLLRVLMAMEDRGVQVDPNFLRKYAESLDKQLGEFDMPLNAYATEQIRSYVYGTLQIEPWKFTATGAPSVDASVLESIDDPVVKMVLDYKGLAQEKSTYTDNYLAQLGADGRIHCEFKQVRTATGRLSSANPNLQNVVKDSDMRHLFIASEGKVLVRMDFSQLELRVFAALTQDEAMLKAFAEGKNIHQETANLIGLPYDDAKVTNFLMLYAGGAWKISQEFHKPIDQAKALIKAYYKAYPGIQKYHEQQITLAHEEKKVSTYFGRVRRLDAMYTNDWRIRAEGEREAINTPIQGTAAEIVKIAMNDLHYRHHAPMILQVHDELLFEVEKSQAKKYAKWLEEYIPTLVEINGVRFPVEVGVGRTWKEASEK